MRIVVGVHLICRILLTTGCEQTALTWNEQHPSGGNHHSVDSVANTAKLPAAAVMDMIDLILRRINAPSGNSCIKVHIDNLYCVSGSQNVKINPCKQQFINVARGDQVLNIGNPRDLTKRSLPNKTYCRHLTDEHDASCNFKIDPDVANHELVAHSDYFNFQRDEPLKPPSTEPISTGYPHSQSVHTRMDKPRSEGERASENLDLFQLGIPDLNVYIDGKPITDLNKHKPPVGEQLSSKLFKDEVRALLLEEKMNSVGKGVQCDREKTPCDLDILTFHGGLELSYEEFRKIIEEVSDKPDYIKLIVPGGVTGPLSGYFQKVDKNLHDHALIHGVCLLNNGLLVPLKAMLRILKLHAWLCEMAPDLNNEDVSKLHSSIEWTQTDGIADLLRCFIKANKIHVILPGTIRVPFAQFEQEEEHIPKQLQKIAKVEMLGFHIPYINFRDKLVALCKGNSK